ncbi:ABC transporter ATP-binding protein [Chelatococcus asaccharovorans]|uniref:Putative spermidine/putrescine transport system ATP-binding protein n=1 Tax=Chelatococcus asaccharovorans TaxID=28210 RepID=A0A2V3TW40_9HYPH|nr:ABC transporter ATP-binding protein [Chelatococcus asaccharovorans]PXW52827.1 putative spermidine/putrescine transport system ATP-binding protein [Chelatococcus asaccharovorans]
MTMSEDTGTARFQVELRNATKLYGDFAAIRDISFGVAKGEFFSILGPSGGGKTTVLRAIAGLIDLTSGDLLIAGAPVNGVPVYRRGMGIVFQNYALFPHMNVFDNIAFGLRMRKVGKPEVHARVTEAMARVHLDGLGGRMPSQLSGGQQQRVALARAIIVNPRVILLDEPLGALDRNLRIAMQAELKSLQRELAITTVCVTHDQEEALSLSDRIAILNKGGVEQIGTPIEIYERPASRFVASFVGGTNLIEVVVHRSDAVSTELILPDADRTLVRVNSGDATVGRAVTLSLRYEAIRIASSPSPSPGDASVLGTVTNIAYGGSVSIFHVAINNGLTLVVAASGKPLFGLGDTVHLSWPSGAGQILQS